MLFSHKQLAMFTGVVLVTFATGSLALVVFKGSPPVEVSPIPKPVDPLTAQIADRDVNTPGIFPPPGSKCEEAKRSRAMVVLYAQCANKRFSEAGKKMTPRFGDLMRLAMSKNISAAVEFEGGRLSGPNYGLTVAQINTDLIGATDQRMAADRGQIVDILEASAALRPALPTQVIEPRQRSVTCINMGSITTCN